MSRIREIAELIKDKSAEDILTAIAALEEERVVFSTSLGLEDQVITHMIFSGKLKINVFTIDTGRLFPETYSTLQQTIKRYSQKINVFAPQTETLEKLVSEKGPYSFYDSVESRKECCYIRKVEPLKRALQGSTIWVTGIRADQSSNRTGMEIVEWDDQNRIIKVNPLLNWTYSQTKSFVEENKIPHNPLHAKGFVSIGCQPCTRPVKEGEDFRAGRWWWEDAGKKECGLHR